ncbi:hypothetical protein PtA15_3A489 [Puccinia triticina]|uniref:RING-type domain-containing protein n=1 Tax=Puccinia triticina TaxID=208348 RepID=A0ABY7CF63_9BASI|nr:uncharacterized protein PtA15_3A489 [Puccinia triticina]WAQ83122.1 hypothetical protein PtA15_3A489 [Puccinia triticina]WAR53966.1 hypothetical protein PtB15_3B475 [Puccinia triticina]
MSRRQSTKSAESHPHISASKSFVLVPRLGDGLNEEAEDDEMFNVRDEEHQIGKLLKLIEPDYLRQRLEPSVTEVHLKTAISDSKQEIRSLAHQLESIDTLVGDLAEFNNTPTGDQLLKDCDQHARDLIEAIQLVEFRQKELEDLRERVHRSTSNQPIDTHDQLCKKISAQLVQWESLTLRQKFAQNKRYKAFRDRIWEVTGEDGAMPPVKTFLPAAPGEEDEDDSSGDELEIAGGKQNYKCPLCIGFLKRPVVSQQCQHTFCKECFDSYLEQNHATVMVCPNSGCSTMIHKSSVKEDEALAARVRQFRRRAERREDSEVYVDERQTQTGTLDLTGEEESKDHLNGRRKPTASQKKRRVVVDDDDDDE